MFQQVFGSRQHDFGAFGDDGEGQGGLIEARPHFAAALINRGGGSENNGSAHARCAADDGERAVCPFVRLRLTRGEYVGKLRGRLKKIGRVGERIGRVHHQSA